MSNDMAAPSRRAVLDAAAAGSMTTLASPIGPAQTQTSAKTFVLVHGGWRGGWCWRRVADLLEKKGHKVFAPTMTGLGERSHLLDAKINLATHVTDIVNVVKWEGPSDIVLVGSIVFLDAFVPESGDSVADKASQPVREAIATLVQKGDSAMKPVPAAVFRVNEKDRAWVDGKCTPHPIATLTEKINVTGAYERIAKKAYIRAKGYPSIPFDGTQAKVAANPAWRVTSWRAATTPWSTCPTG